MHRIAFLDGLRGIAAFIVVLSHFVYAFYPALETGSAFESHTINQLELWIASSPLNIFYSGNFAVCTFFVLSGFVLTYGFFKDRNYQVLISVAMRRYFRLEIPIFFTLVLTYGMMKSSLFCNQKIIQITQSTWWLAKCWNFEPQIFEALKQSFFYVLFDPSNSRNLYVGVMWTLPYEFLGSFLVFAIAALSVGKKWRFFFYALLAALFINSYFHAFILGLILADLYGSADRDFLKIKSLWVKGVIIGLALYFGSYPAVITSGTIHEWIQIPIISHQESFCHILGSFFLLVFLLNSRVSQRMLSHPFPQFLGRISFSMYLLHTLIIGSSASFMFPLLLKKLPYFAAFLTTLIVNCLLIFFASMLMHRFIDHPTIRFVKFAYDALNQKFQNLNRRLYLFDSRILLGKKS